MEATCLGGSLRTHLACLPPTWQQRLGRALATESTRALVEFIDARIAAGQTVFPPQPLAALHASEPEDVRVVILGQDPYHGAGQAQGYAFSVPAGVRPPPSLRNIFVELERDCACPAPNSGDLRGWSRQGVLLLNTVLTVEEGRPGSHAQRGWEPITDAIIDTLASLPGPKVFMLWGAHAQAKRQRIEARPSPRLVLLANHPSPLSARRAPIPFIGCSHFSRANVYLAEHGLRLIDWCVSTDRG